MQDLFEWFERTHEIQATLGAAWWSMVRLPGPGAVGEQDARLMAHLDALREMRNALVAEEKAKGDPDQERQAFHERVRAEDR